MAAGDVQRGAAKERLTLFALATGAPPTAIAVVRVSGPDALTALMTITGRPLPRPRMLVRRTLIDAGGAPVDEAMVVIFPGPASATGDDVVELHVHGGVAVVAAVLALCDACGLSPAPAGGFVRRAFDNGKLDLGEVAALGDLISAETDGQRRAALARNGSALAERVEQWRGTLIAVRANLEATLDFAEEDEVAAALTDADRAALTALAADLAAAQLDGERAGRLRDGVTIAVVGPPNSGKSTLVNVLVRRESSMVSPLPGTTRDVVEARVVLSGLPLTVLDTAGVRASDDPLESEGIRRGAARAAAADIVVAFGPNDRSDALRVTGKSDLDPAGAGWREGVLHLSAKTGAGVDDLVAWLTQRIARLAPVEAALVAHRWQVAALIAARTAIDAALASTDTVIAADDLRAATLAIERLTGRVALDDILDAVFARFCIGK